MKKIFFRIFIKNGLLFRSLRLILVLFMCLTILWLSGPCQVYASGLAGALYQIAGNIGVNAALRAIGVGPGNSPDAYNTLVTNISDALAPASDFIMDVLIAGSSGNWKTFFSLDRMKSILDYLYDARVLNNNTIPSPVSSALFSYNGNSYLYDIVSGSASVFVAVASISNDSRYFCGVFCSSDSSFTVRVDINAGAVVNSYGSSVPSGGSSYIFSGPTFYSDSEDVSSLIGLPVVYIGEISKITSLSMYVSLFNGGSITTSYDLTLDSVASSLDDDPYIPWVENSIFNNGETFVPVSLPSMDSSVVSSQTQAQAQAGTAADAVVDEIIAGSEVVPDTGTGTIADVISAIKAIPASLADFFADVVAAVQAVPVAIADVFTPSGTVEVYSLDLKQFFPFCIPYDIYSMLAALAADPVAPKFDFEIDLGPVGILPISVDFSEWDDVAALLRTCEAALFAVGLAVKTKELIGW